jgi:hypothetical protein
MSASSIGTYAGFAAAPFNPIIAGVGNVIGGAKDALDAGKDARKGQQRLEESRAKQLRDEAAAREAAAAKAAGRGKTAGARSSFMSAFGFGSGNTSQGLGVGSLFGQ